MPRHVAKARKGPGPIIQSKQSSKGSDPRFALEKLGPSLKHPRVEDDESEEDADLLDGDIDDEQNEEDAASNASEVEAAPVAEDDNEEEEEEEENEEAGSAADEEVEDVEQHDSEDDVEVDEISSHDDSRALEQKKVPKAKRPKISAMSAEDLANYNAAAEKRGIIYMSRIPPFMKPEKVRHLMSQHGDVGRVYLREEDKLARKRRLQQHGSKKKFYIEGWVEFQDKKIAKRVAANLNATKVGSFGGSRRGFHYEELWTLKYLPKFKWHHLTERMSYERAVRNQMLRAEMAQVRKETDLYRDRVEQTKKVAHYEKKMLEEGKIPERRVINAVKQRAPIAE